MHAQAVSQALTTLATQREEQLGQLQQLVRIPGVSADGFPVEPLADCAREVARQMELAGLNNVEVVHHKKAPPYVLGEWLAAAGAPTVLIYGHYDVQPPGNPERWHSPPFAPEIRDGRLYGRGAVDDKAGIAVHLAAVKAWLDSTGRLPVNVKFIIEGEEEVGSPYLESFLAQHNTHLAADCLILTDTCNLDEGVPSLTVSLRGMVSADLTVSVLDGPLHSGIWGGPIPDPVQALAKILARLSDARGQVAIPGIQTGPVTAHAYRDLPFDAGAFRAQGGLLPEVPLLTAGGPATYWSIWNAPTVTVTGLDAVPIADSSNQLLPSARARVGVRLAPGQDPDACLAALVRFLNENPPWGCRVQVDPHASAGGWRTDPDGPFFDAARAALESGFDHPATLIGCGGSIPFVEPFARAMGNIPALLLGVEDPACRAHGENESLSLADFDKACRAAVHLYAGIGIINVAAGDTS